MTRRALAAAAAALVAVLPTRAQPALPPPAPAVGFELGMQPRMFLPGARLATVIESPVSARFTLEAQAGLWCSLFNSPVHDTVDVHLSASAGLLWEPVATGVAVSAHVRALSVRDGSPVQGSAFSSLMFGPVLRSRIPIVRSRPGRRVQVSLVPEAGLLWALARSGFGPVPDWHLGAAARVLWTAR